MAGVTSASMFMHIVENKTYGNRAFTNLSEQMAKILRMGANDQSVIDRLNWMRDVLGPMLRDAMNIIGEIDLRLMLAQALHMGDECHNRNNAGTTLLIQALTPGLIQAGYPAEQQREVFEFVASSDYFSGPTWMAMCKAALDAAHGIEYSTVVTTMARNGYEFGLRVSGLPGQWFTGPAQQVIGPMFAGYKPEDSGLDIGDSAITETYGIGGFAMATAPQSWRWWAARWRKPSTSPVRCAKSPLAKTRTSPFRCSPLWGSRPPSTSRRSRAAAFCRSSIPPLPTKTRASA